MGTLEAIIHYGLSVRQIPDKVYSTLSICHLEPGDEIVEHKLDDKWNFRVMLEKNGNNENFRFDIENKAIYRRWARKTRIPQNAGYWMCKQVGNTDSRVQWSLKTDNLAPTLEESVNLFIQSFGGRING